jgi:hypothetical protein
MSVAVAVHKGRTVAIAADTQENFGDRRVLRGDHRSSKIMKVGTSFVAQTGWGLYENILGDYLARTGTPRFRSEHEIFVFFNRFWKRMRKDYSFVNDQPISACYSAAHSWEFSAPSTIRGVSSSLRWRSSISFGVVRTLTGFTSFCF